jgi:multiple sugar transport system substrate-binding protein
MRPALAMAVAAVLLFSACSATTSTPSAASAVGTSIAPATSSAPVAASAATSSAGTGASSAAPGASAGATTYSRAYAGQTVTLWQIERPTLSDLEKPLLASFEQATGINVNFQTFPEAAYNDKLTLAQTAHDSSYDVFEGDVASRGQFASRNSVIPLDSYINSPASASWDYADIPAGLHTLCQYNGQTLCIDQGAGGQFFYYNKALFAAAGISGPPKTIQEMVTDAAKTNDPAKGIAGICMRNTPGEANQFTGFQLSAYFLPYNPNDKAVILGPDWKPMLNTPQALQWATTYQTLMRNYAPPGIASYGYTECNRDFEAGKVAEYFESDGQVGEFLDPTHNPQLKNTGFYFIPCAPVNPNNCNVTASHAWYINKDSQHQAAAWELVEWLSSKEVVSSVAVNGGGYLFASRTSSLQALAATGKYPADVQAAFAYEGTHEMPSPFPPIPEIFGVVQPVSIMLSKISAGQETPQAALAEAQTAITKVLTPKYIK